MNMLALAPIFFSVASGLHHQRRTLPSSAAVMRVRGGSSVIHPSDTGSFKDAIAPANGNLVVLYFSATWCGPCRMIAPAFDALADQMHPDVVFVKIDVEEVPEATQQYDVSSLPTFVLVRDGSEIERFSGASIEKLRATLSSNGATVPSNDIF